MQIFAINKAKKLSSTQKIFRANVFDPASSSFDLPQTSQVIHTTNQSQDSSYVKNYISYINFLFLSNPKKILV